MKTIKKLLYLIIIAVVFITIGYFVTSFTQFNGNIEQEVFRNSFFRTKDESGFISFGSFKNTVLCVNGNYYFISDVNYDNGIFLLKDKNVEEAYYKIGVVSEDIIYSSDFNTYFYNINLWNEV